MELLELFKYDFIVRALFTGLLVAMTCSLLGIFLVLKRLSLIGDGLAHITFGGVALGLLTKNDPFYIALPFSVLSSLGILKLTHKSKIYGDAAIGIISAAGIAGGVIVSHMAGGFNIDIFSYLFGNILAISKSDMYISVILSVVVCGLILIYLDDLFSMAFDEELAKITGIDTVKLNYVLSMLTAITVVMSMRVVGIMLVSALLILPSVSALQIFHSYRKVSLFSIIFSVTSVLTGITISFVYNLPSGATIVMVNFLIFLCCLMIKYLESLKTK